MGFGESIFCLFASAQTWSSPTFVWPCLVYCTQGGRQPKPRGFVWPRSCRWVLPGLFPSRSWTTAPHSGSEDLFTQPWLSQTNPKINEVWVWSWKIPGCVLRLMKRAVFHAGVREAGAAFPSSQRVSSVELLLAPVPATYSMDLAGVQN